MITMMTRLALLVGFTSCFALLGLQEQPSLPPGHPPMPSMPQMPPGHPAIGQQAPATRPAGEAIADPRDVESPDSIMTAYYDSISGTRGQARNWERFRSLFLPEARMITPRPLGNDTLPVVIAPAHFVAQNRAYFESGGYLETEVHRKVDVFGNIAQIFSTYESRRDPAEDAYSRGINSVQLVRSQGRWWIATVLWEHERPDVAPIPPDYLP